MSCTYCPAPAKKRQMCDMHYMRVRRHGDPHAGDMQRCTAPGCPLPVKGHGLCALHHMRAYRARRKETA